MPKTEKDVHRKAFELFMAMGGIVSKKFLSAFEKEFGKSQRTFWRWYCDFGWKQRTGRQVEEAIENLQAAGVLNAEELISGFLDLCRIRMNGIKVETEYIKAIFARAFDKIPKKQLNVETISDLAELIRAESRLIRDEQGYMRLVMMLVGKPEQIMEDRMIVEFVGMDEDVFTNAEQDLIRTNQDVRKRIK